MSGKPRAFIPTFILLMAQNIASNLEPGGKGMLGAQRLDWEDIKAFVAVADSGTVRRAARQLGVHHSTLSRRIESLEHSLDAKLFDRQPEGFVLTASGERLAATARECSRNLTDAERFISGQDKELSGDIRVTLPPAIATQVIGP